MKLAIKITHDKDQYREVKDSMKCLHRKGFLRKFVSTERMGNLIFLKKNHNSRKMILLLSSSIIYNDYHKNLLLFQKTVCSEEYF